MNEEKFAELISVVKNQEYRIDYNFNTTLQMTLLVEFLYEKLVEKFPEMNLTEEFPEFQKKRVEELENIIEENKDAFSEESIEKIVNEAIGDHIKL